MALRHIVPSSCLGAALSYLVNLILDPCSSMQLLVHVRLPPVEYAKGSLLLLAPPPLLFLSSPPPSRCHQKSGECQSCRTRGECPRSRTRGRAIVSEQGESAMVAERGGIALAIVHVGEESTGRVSLLPNKVSEHSLQN